MKNLKNLAFVAGGLLTLTLTSCSTTKIATNDGHNAQNSLDYAGVYYGVLPCADCSGIGTKVYVNMDKTYVLEQNYLGKKDAKFLEDGSYSWNTAGNTISLKPKTKNGSTYNFFVGENTLTMLDQKSKKITGNLKDYYILTKGHAELYGKTWQLKEMYNMPFDKNKTMKKQGYITFDEKEMRFSANAGCNQMNGSFEIKGDNQMTFGNAMSTMMACNNMQDEQTLSKVLTETKMFQILDGKLVLMDGKQNIIASFSSSKK